MTPDLSVAAGRIVATIGEMDASAEPAVRDRAAVLVRDTMAFYGAGLARVVEIVRADAAGTALLERLAGDPAVAAILSLHDLLPASAAPAARGPLVQIERRRGDAVGDAGRAAGHASGAPSTRCERCGGPLAEAHRHVVDLDTRAMRCACDACWAAVPDGGADALVAVPDRGPEPVALRLSDAHWDALEIPVGLTFFVQSSRAARTFAFYPSPAGAVESLLPLAAWADVVAANPRLTTLAPDVEALIVRRDRGGTTQSAVVPVDACYDLIGRMRVQWSGFEGGDAVRAEIERFFTAPIAVEHVP